LIEEFKAGLLPLAEGTSLRTFLSKMLNCQPMRISKKFVGSNYNGKAPYVRKKNTLPNEEVRARRAKLQELERKFLAKASPMSTLDSSGDVKAAASGEVAAPRQPGISVATLTGSTSASLLSAAGLPTGFDAAALLAGRSNSRAAAAGRALLLGGSGLGGSGGLGDLKPSAAAVGAMASATSLTNLAGFSSSELAAELEKRAKSELRTRTSVENFLGSAAELQARASVETLLQNPFGGSHSGSRSNLFGTGSRTNLLSGAGSRTDLLNAARNSFHHGTSASNLLNAALQKNSTSNLLNAARNSFHKNSTSNLFNAASAFGRGPSASNLLQNASFAKRTSASNLLNAMASSGGLAGLRGTKNSTSNLLNAARAAGGSSAAAAAGLRSLLDARAAKGAAEGLKPAGSLADLLERHNSGLDLKSRVSSLMEGSASQNWARTGSGVGLAGAARGSRTNLSSLRLDMLKNGGDIGAASSVFANASFGDRAKSSASRTLELAALLKEQGMSGAAALAAAAKEEASILDKESLTTEMVEKEALMQQLLGSAGGSSSAIGDYLLKQQLMGGSAPEESKDSAATAADQAELMHMMELKRKFLSQDADEAERAAKRLR
jgi:hypothetical protein